VLQDGQLDQNIGRMRYQTMDLLIKMSRLLQHKKLGTTFLVVNFHHVCMVRRCRAPAAAPCITSMLQGPCHPAPALLARLPR
jgi:hypothetical protein